MPEFSDTELLARSRELDEVIAALDRERSASEADRERLQAVLASMRDGVLVVDSNGDVVLSNAAYDALFADDPVILDPAGEPLPTSELPQTRAARGETFTMPFRIAGSDGGLRWFEAKAHPVEFAGRDLCVMLVRDISERSLRLLQEEFIALASHELRTPLTAVQAYVQLLARRPEIRENPTLAAYAENAVAETKRLAALITELSEATRLQSGRLSLERHPVDLRALIRRVADISRPLTDGQEIRFEPGEPVVADVDARRFEQVLFNLVSNAITHASESPSIDIDLRVVAGRAEIRVTDAGRGIPPAEAPHLFSRFYQVSRRHGGTERGLGLGLYISREIIRAHGGEITVASSLGKGTTFTVRIPLAPSDTGTAQEGRPEPGERA